MVLAVCKMILAACEGVLAVVKAVLAACKLILAGWKMVLAGAGGWRALGSARRARRLWKSQWGGGGPV